MRSAMPSGGRLPVALLAIGGAMCSVLWPASDAYRAQIEEWRRQRVVALKADGGWLTVAGLFWLHEGANSFGSASSNDFVLPAGPAGKDGAFDLHNGKVTLRLDGQTRELRPDSNAKPDVVTLGSLTLFAIRRGGKYGIRLKDNHSRLRQEFAGLEYFPISEDYRFAARLVPDAKKIPILNILGQVEDTPSPGYVEFEIHGQKCG